MESLTSAHNQINQELSKMKLEYGSLSLPEAGNQSDVEASLRKQISKLVAELESFRGAPEDIDTNKEGVTTESLRKEIMIVRQHYSAAQQQLEEMKQNHEKLRRWSFDVMKSGKENSTLKAEWASAQARAALAEAKVKSLTEQNNDLVSLVTKSRLEVQQKKQILDDLKQELNSQILCVAKVLEDMAEHQQINVNEVSDLQLDMTKAAEARTEEIFQKAAEKSKKVANMLRQQGRRVGDHMEKYQAILMRWSKSVESASAAVKDGDKTETQDAILSTNDEGCKEGAAFKDTAAEPASTSSIEQPDKEVVNYNKEDSDFVMPEPESEQTGATGTETECKEGAVFENTAVESVSITSSMEQSDKKVNNCDKEESDFAMPESEQTGASGTVVPAYYHPEVIEEEAELDEEPEVEDDESDRDDARADAIKEETETEEPTESIDEYDNEHRAGVIPLENEIEMFHNPYTPGTPCG